MSRQIAFALTAFLCSSFLALPGSGLGSVRLPPPTLYWLHGFKLNLDKDKALECVQVYDLRLGPMSTPSTYYRVGDIRGGKLVYLGPRLVYQSPGSSESGLEHAWVRDLNADSRVEIAVHDFATPSIGDVLTVYRQKKAHDLRFSRLQRIVGDQIAIGKTRAPVTWKVLIKSTHAPDGRNHHEVWTWSKTKKRWTCSSDCVPR